MKTTVLALFENESDLQASLSELKDQGYENWQLKSFSSQHTPASGSKLDDLGEIVETDYELTSCELYQNLRKFNVPPDQSLLITETVRTGLHLAVVIDLNERADEIADFFEKHRALNFEVCCQNAQQRHHEPGFDDTVPPFLKIPEAGSNCEIAPRAQNRQGHHDSVKVYEFTVPGPP